MLLGARAAALVLAVAGCAAPLPRDRLPVRLVVVSDDPAVRQAFAIERVDGVIMLPVELPTVAPLPAAAATVELAAAREAYASADGAACAAALDPVDLAPLLARGDRDLVARVLALRIGCRISAGDRDAAQNDAEAFAALHLAVPADERIDSTTEGFLDEIGAVAAARPAVPVAITSTPPGARVALDGGGEACTTPCSLAMAPGSHVIGLAADGRVDAWRRIVVPGEATLEVALEPATPELAASQLRVRLARGAGLDDATSLHLAAAAVRARRVMVVGGGGPGGGGRLIGALVDRKDDGRERTARAERSAAGDLGVPARALVRELLLRTDVTYRPAIWRQPRFWIAVGVAAVVSAAITAWIVFEPDPASCLVFGEGGCE